MKNLFYLSLLCVFIACGGGTEEAPAEAVPAAAPEAVVADLGCKTEGGKCLGDHSCFAVSEESEEVEATEETTVD